MRFPTALLPCAGVLLLLAACGPTGAAPPRPPDDGGETGSPGFGPDFGSGSEPTFALTIVGEDDRDLVQGFPFTATFQATGGVGGYEWRLSEGALPPGLTGLPSAGSVMKITGLPREPGSFERPLELHDASGAVTRTTLDLKIEPNEDPARWHEITKDGAPTARGHHTAVWTGHEMIVWGGVDGYWTPVGTGGAYNMISRSLGFEVGGAVGIPLYIAQTLSIALYVIGFSESLVGAFPMLDATTVGIVTAILVAGVAILYCSQERE